MAVEELNPQQAFELLQSDRDAIVLDVRSKVEFDYVGHPIGAIHIPWADYPAWDVNPALFVAQVRALLQETDGPVEDRPILAICRSGGRSMAAAQALSQAGFNRLYNVAEGFEGVRDADRHRNTVNGWRFRGLPWEQT